ncbi:uncharacterized protein TRAVEDRAFT_53976 [Trametes versicolor FP-101664 SS1]|uniref:Uncharacterized protein n=1 Tax=Trametes versicolor (strain FP-101664) TaxID=717944 RepID=R7S8K9_TRAVS|nr:uncharacterized protein TRAVEDRAFT_53976 [Trametes versicolor FP-101664 SS1]EIW51992.1 hypothetical protein TRAVEDRAFT_53976 [Trametes versicolor FP-101664 SS1]
MARTYESKVAACGTRRVSFTLCLAYMRQNYCFTDDERRWLKQHLSDADVRAILLEPKTTAPNKRAAGLLTEKFRAHFTAPSTGETQEAWLKRYNNASRDRRDDIARHAPEDFVAFSARMERLPKSIYNWVRENLYTGPRAKTGLDVFQASSDAPVVEVLDVEGRHRAAVGQHRAACADAWKALLPEEQERYNAIAEEKNKERAAEREESVPINEGFTALEISNAVDDSMDMVHNVHWGGLICVGGPDETGEPSVYMTSRGVNRQGLTFLQALCQTAGWTEQEFYLVLSLWVEQSRSGGEDADAADFAVHAQRIMEQHRAIDETDAAQPVVQPSSAEGIPACNVITPAPIITACIDPTLRAPAAALRVGAVIQGKSLSQSNDVPETADIAEADIAVDPEVSENLESAAAAQLSEPAPAGPKNKRPGKKVTATKTKGAGRKLRKGAETSGVVIPDASASSAVTSRPSRIRTQTARAQGQDPLISLTERISASGSVSTGRPRRGAGGTAKGSSKRRGRA